MVLMLLLVCFLAIHPARAVHRNDSLALVALYNSTNGDNWRYHTNWLTAPVDTWQGITVENNRVTKIELMSNTMTGELPAAMGQLQGLQVLKISSNSIEGELPETMRNLKELYHFEISYNRFSGDLPSWLGEMTALQIIYFHSNRFTGTLSPEIGNLSNLVQLYLLSNQISGSIPSEIGQLKNLTHLYISWNKFTGSIPPEIGEITKLHYLNLEQNQLTGEIPKELGNPSNLAYIYLQSNRISGSIPKELGQLGNLHYLRLYNNQLSGNLPPELGNCTNLREVSLQQNQLDGELPVEWSALFRMHTLNLSINQLSGTLPPELGELSALQNLNLSVNRFSGSIPPELASLSALKQLQLERNQLTGSIPAELDQLQNLELLSLGSNLLDAFPANNLHVLTNLQTVNVFYNNFTFEDLEHNMELSNKYFYYAPQNPVGPSQVIRVDTGANYTLEINCGGSENAYQWFLNHEPVSQVSSQSSHRLTNIGVNDLGTYSCTITNPLVPGLSLESNPILIQFTPVGKHEPYDILLSNQSVPENQPVGTVVGQLATLDDDYYDTHTYALVGGEGAFDNAHFFIAANQLHTQTVFDYEEKNKFAIRVQTTDNSGAVFSKLFTIEVSNTDEKEDLFIPDAFSPNNDGYNDVLEIPELENYTGVQLRIYNREGILVYEHPSYGSTADSWWRGTLMANGRSSETILPEGHYFCIIDLDEDTQFKKTIFLKH